MKSPLYFFLFALTLIHLIHLKSELKPGLSWYWQLEDVNESILDRNASIYDVDLFDTPKHIIESIGSPTKYF